MNRRTTVYDLESQAFVVDVADGGYPEAQHQLEMDEDAFDQFLKLSQSS